MLRIDKTKPGAPPDDLVLEPLTAEEFPSACRTLAWWEREFKPEAPCHIAIYVGRGPRGEPMPLRSLSDAYFEIVK